MKKFGIAAAIAGVAMIGMTATATPSLAQDWRKPWYEEKLLPDPFSMTVAFWSNYRFRGISQTSNAPGYNGSIDWEQEFWPNTSLYFGVWASNVKFADAKVEVDVYGGIKGKITPQLSYNLQFIGYLYPGTAGSGKLHYFEVMPSLSYDFGWAEVTGGVALSPRGTADSGFTAWPYADISVPIPVKVLEPYKVKAFAHVGYQMIEKNANFGTPDYWEWEAGISAQVYGFKLTVKYGDTNLSKAECFGGTKLCRAAAVFVVSKTF